MISVVSCITFVLLGPLLLFLLFLSRVACVAAVALVSFLAGLAQFSRSMWGYLSGRFICRTKERRLVGDRVLDMERRLVRLRAVEVVRRRSCHREDEWG